MVMEECYLFHYVCSYTFLFRLRMKYNEKQLIQIYTIEHEFKIYAQKICGVWRKTSDEMPPHQSVDMFGNIAKKLRYFFLFHYFFYILHCFVICLWTWKWSQNRKQTHINIKTRKHTVHELLKRTLLHHKRYKN